MDRKLYNEVALCMKTELVEDMIQFCDERGARDDRKIEVWAKTRKLLFYYCLPSLVDHKPVESIYRQSKDLKDERRQAVWFADKNFTI
jgi:hypothetical protein